MSSLSEDVRYALRVLFRRPGAAALAVISVGLATGFSTAAFSILDAYALRDLAVHDPNSLARVSARTRENRPDNLSWSEFQAVASRVHSFTGVLVEDREGARVKLPTGDAFPIIGYVSDNYFDVLGVKAERGEVFHAGAGQAGTAVISHRYWSEKFANDLAILGRVLPVGESMLRIVAVLPPDFTGTHRGLLVDLFLPPQTFFAFPSAAKPGDTRYTSYEVTGRCRPGATLDQARAEIDAALREVEAAGQAPGPARSASTDAFGDGTLKEKLETNAVLLGVVVLLVAIAGANLANLRLVDNEGRRQETGIRLALGAGLTELVRQHVAETVLLAGAGTAAGLVLAHLLDLAAASLFYGGKSFVDYGIRLDVRGFAFSSAALLVVAVAGAAIPMMDAWRRRVSPVLHGTRSTRPSRWFGVLLVTQMALVTGVVCSAGLLWRSLEKLAAVRPAMDPSRAVLLVNGFYDLTGREANQRAGALADSLGALPGIESVAWARRVMLSGSGGGAIIPVEVAGQPKASYPYNQVSPAYFTTTGARILSGRPFSEGDSADAAPVAMVNSLFARRYFGDRDPVGRWIQAGGRQRQVVAVVEDGPHNHLQEAPTPYLYFPFAQMPTPYMTWLIHTSKDPSDVAGAVRNLVHGADAGFTLLSMRTLREHLKEARSDQEVAMQVAGSLAGVGLLLAAAGLFGVTLFAVARRMPEFGIRAALGAGPGSLLGMVLREAALRVALALPLGWGLASLGRNAIAKLLYGVAPDDPGTFAVASVLVALVACAAALVPALRAARVDPMSALRHE